MSTHLSRAAMLARQRRKARPERDTYTRAVFDRLRDDYEGVRPEIWKTDTVTTYGFDPDHYKWPARQPWWHKAADDAFAILGISLAVACMVIASYKLGVCLMKLLEAAQ